VPVIFDPSFMPNAAAAVPHTIGLRLPRIWGTPAHKAMYLTYRDGKGFSRPGNPPSAARSTRHMVRLYPRTPRVAESENLQAIGDRRPLSRPRPSSDHPAGHIAPHTTQCKHPDHQGARGAGLHAPRARFTTCHQKRPPAGRARETARNIF